MAIIVQEEKSTSSFPLMGVLAFIAVLGMVGGVAYYFFFSPTPLAETVGTDQYNEASEIAKIKLDVGSVTNTKEWNYFKPFLPFTPPVFYIKRTNPFESF